MTDGIQLAPDELRRLLAARPKQAADVIYALQHPIRTEYDVIDLLETVTHLAVDLIDGADWAGVTAQFDSSPFTAASTHARVQSVDDVQYALDDGPCLRAMRSRKVVAMSAADVRSEFPDLASAAQQSQVGSFLAAPLGAHGESVGALNLYSQADAGFDGIDEDFIAILSGCADRGLSEYATTHSAETLAAQLHQAIQNRAPIEQAKGILMAVHQISPEEAFGMLREQSMRGNVKLHDLAVSFVAENASRGDSADQATPTLS